MEEVIVGLCAGRHDMPVDEFIFNKVDDVFDFDNMREKTTKFLHDKVGFSINLGYGFNQASEPEVEVFMGDRKLVLYVTGLTSLTAEVIRQCAYYGISLTLMHYNKDAMSYDEKYIPQVIFN